MLKEDLFIAHESGTPNDPAVVVPLQGPDLAEVEQEMIPMHDRRPSWLTDMIDAQFTEVSGDAEAFVNNGTEGDYTIAGYSTTELIESYRRAVHNDGPLRILDVGTGAGGFITRNNWQDGDLVQGVSAFDYRSQPEYADIAPQADDPRYVVGNAEYVARLPGLAQSYDFVVSELTITHFIDYLGSLEQIADLVAQNGVLCVNVNQYSNNEHAAQAAALLEANGFSRLTHGDQTDEHADLLMIRSSAECPVAFDTGYAQHFYTEEFLSKHPYVPPFTLEYVSPS